MTEKKRRWKEPGCRPPTSSPAPLLSGGDCDPQSYHTGAPEQARTRARQRKVVLVRVSAPMGVFVCLCFCTYVCEPRGVWVGCIQGQQTRRIPLKQVLQVYFLFMRVLNVTGFVWMGRQATYVYCRVYTVQAVSLRNCVLIFEVTFYEGFFFQPSLPPP